jgi:hypothetical protein
MQGHARGHMRSRALCAVLLASVLAGCGGGGGDDDEVDTRILATGDPIVPQDFVGKSFPLLYFVARDGDPDAVVAGGEGQIRVVDANSVVISLPGERDRRLTRIPGTEDFEGPDGQGGTIIVQLTNLGHYYFARCPCGAFDGYDFASVYGFETPTDLRPGGTATYSGVASGVAFAAVGSPEALVIPGGGTGALIADFSDASISGVLIDSGVLTALDADGLENDEVFVTLTMDGAIDPMGFTGTVNGVVAVSVDGGPLSAVPTTFSNTRVDGKFFGNSGETAGAAYGGDVVINSSSSASDALDGAFRGFFVGTDNALAKD